MTHVEEFTNLTKAEVEALLECFDFLRNGYQDMGTYNFDSVAIYRLRHKRKNVWIMVVSRPDSYDIYKQRELRKSETFTDDLSRYRLFVNSDMTVGVVRLNAGGGQKVVPG